jgi:hypothetical protein
MLCVTLHDAAESDNGLISSKRKTHLKQKIPKMEIVQAGSDHVTAQ